MQKYIVDKGNIDSLKCLATVLFLCTSIIRKKQPTNRQVKSRSNGASSQATQRNKLWHYIYTSNPHIQIYTSYRQLQTHECIYVNQILHLAAVLETKAFPEPNPIIAEY